MQGEPVKVIHSYPEWLLSGVSSWTAKLMRGIDPGSIEQRILITGQPDESGKRRMPPEDLAVDCLKTPRGVKRKDFYRRLKEYLESKAPCVYLPNYDFDAAAGIGLLSPRVAVCAGIRSDDPIYYEYTNRLGHSWDAAITVSRHLKDTLCRQHPQIADRIAYIPNGVEIGAENTKRTFNKQPRVLYCNRVSHQQKRALDLVPIAEALSREIPEFLIEVIGDGPDLDELKSRVARAKLTHNFAFYGQMPHAEALSKMNESDCFVLTSEFEGMPNSLLEAMAVGLVPVTYNIDSGVPEIIEHESNGFAVPLGDTAAMAKAIAQIFKDGEMSSSMSTNARNKIINEFSSKQMCEAYEAYFLGLGNAVKLANCKRRDGKIRLPPNTRLVSRLKKKLLRM